MQLQKFIGCRGEVNPPRAIQLSLPPSSHLFRLNILIQHIALIEQQKHENKNIFSLVRAINFKFHFGRLLPEASFNASFSQKIKKVLRALMG
jgi:hypothetical protein